MPTTDKNKSGGHSHPQKENSQSNKDQGDTQRTTGSDSTDAGGSVLPSGEKVKSHQGPKESFGSHGPKDSH